MSKRTKTYQQPTADPDVVEVSKSVEHDPQFSFEMAVNAKGEPSFKIKDYGHNGYNVIERALDMAVQVCRSLNLKISTLQWDPEIHRGGPELRGVIAANHDYNDDLDSMQ